MSRQIAVLGPLEVRRADGAPLAVRSRRQRLLLALLVARPGRVVAADELIEALWGDALPVNPLAALQSQVHRLRRDVGPVVVTDDAGYRIDLAHAEIDAVRFESIALRPEATLSDLDVALALWRGRAYGELAEHPAVEPEAVRLDELHASARERRAELLLGAGRAGAAATAAAELSGEHPYRERPVAVAMQALAGDGRHVEALRTFQAFRTRLGEELGVEPSPALCALEAAIVRHDHPPPPVVGLPGNSLVGRERDLADVAALLGSGRLVTLAGPGGVGKTRLAMHAAVGVAPQFPDGVHVCELAEVSDPGAVPAALASVLQIHARGDRGLQQRAVEFLHAKQALLVLDNCEHLLDRVAELVRVLLARTADVVVLATSRQRLGVDGERVVRVRPLPVGTDEELESAIGLFVDRSRAAGIDRTLTADDLAAAGALCRRLDGLPLAIELAAARSVARTPAELLADLGGHLDRLADERRAVGRHRSIEATIAWSYGMLDPFEQTVFRATAVFAGGCILPAVARVLDCSTEMVGSALDSLVDQSLLSASPSAGRTRFVMLEPVRQFAHARQVAVDELTAARAAHAAWACDWLTEADAGLRTADEVSWASAIDHELSNLRAAHHWCLEHDRDRAAQLVADLFWYGYFYGPAELFAWADATVAGDEATVEPSPALPGALATAALGAWRRTDPERARALARRAIALADRPESARLAWEALRSTEVMTGNYARALEHGARAMELARLVGDTVHEAHDRIVGALALGYLGRRDEADAELIAAASLLDVVDNPTERAFADYVAGEILVDVAPEEALPYLERSRDRARSIGNRFVAGIAGVSAVSCAARLGDPERVLAEYADLIDYFHRIDASPQLWTTMRTLVETLTRIGEHDTATILHGALEASPASPPIRGADAARMATAVDTLRVGLTAPRFEVLHREGAAMGDERAIALAVSATRGAASG